MNKNGRFRKDNEYVFYLPWQKEMCELAAGVYNFPKGTRQHALPVREFMGRVLRSDDDVLTPFFQCMCGSNQYWHTRRSELLCIVREYGLPSIFLTLSCAQYDNPEIDSYLRKVNKVSDSYPISRLCTGSCVCVKVVLPPVSLFLSNSDHKGRSTGSCH